MHKYNACVDNTRCSSQMIITLHSTAFQYSTSLRGISVMLALQLKDGIINSSPGIKAMQESGRRQKNEFQYLCCFAHVEPVWYMT